MGARELPGYCSYTKAIEHLGDRWSLLIVRQLGAFGPLGFNEMTRALPGRISRSVLTDRLKRLETMGIVSRDGAGYRLTTVGAGLMPVLSSLHTWADTWLPEDPAMVQRDPDVVLAWLAQRVRNTNLPGEPVVLEISVLEDGRYWLVLQDGAAPYGCVTDPMLGGRYVYLQCAVATLLALARGRRNWSDAFADGSLVAAGDPVLCHRIPAWFDPDRTCETAIGGPTRPAS